MRQHIQGELDITINLELTKIHGHAEFHYDKNSSDINEDIEIQVNPMKMCKSLRANISSPVVHRRPSA
jgi:hypothetical protein